MLPDKLRNLPYNGKRIFYKFYERSLHKFNSAKIATKLAVCAVGKKYTFVDGQWRPRPDANDADTTSSSDSGSNESICSDSESTYSEDNVPHSRGAV